jgi:Tol biopolymer transport system component
MTASRIAPAFAALTVALAACADAPTAANSSKLTPGAADAVVKPCKVGCSTRIAYSRLYFPANSVYPDSGHIFTMLTDGTSKQQLTFGWGDSRDPSWSPGYTKIAFSSLRRGTNNHYKIFVMNADGSDVTQLTPSDNYDDELPRWSPDGKKLVFSSDRGPGSSEQLWVVNADGTGLTQLTSDSYYYRTPQWAPDGSALYFSTNRVNNQWDVGMLTLRGFPSGVKMLTNTPTEDEIDIALSPDGSRFVAATINTTSNIRYVNEYDAATGAKLSQVLQYLTQYKLARNLTYAPNGATIGFTEYEYHQATGQSSARVMRRPLGGLGQVSTPLTPAGEYNMAGGWAR